MGAPTFSRPALAAAEIATSSGRPASEGRLVRGFVCRYIAATARHAGGRVGTRTLTTATLFARRFVLARGVAALEPPAVACAALLLAAKAEEEAPPLATADLLAAAQAAAAAGGWSPGGRKPEWAREVVALGPPWPAPPTLSDLLAAEVEVLACLTSSGGPGGGGLEGVHPFEDAVAVAVAAVDGWEVVRGRRGGGGGGGGGGGDENAPPAPSPPAPSPTARALAARACGALQDAFLFTDVALVASPAVLAVAAIVVGAAGMGSAAVCGGGGGGARPSFTLSPAFLASLPRPGLVLGCVAAAAADMAAGYEAASHLGGDGGADAAGRAVAAAAAARGGG